MFLVTPLVEFLHVGEQIYPDGVEMPERGMAPVLQIGRMSVSAEVDAEWNAWYSREYVPG